MYLLDLLYAYLIGGVTFIPLLIFAFVYLHPKQPPVCEEYESLKAGEIEEDNLSGLNAYKQGWITVTHEFLESPDQISSSTQLVADSQEGKLAYASLYNLVKNSNAKTKESNGEKAVVSDSEASSMTLTPGASTPTKGASKKHRYYAVLKHGNLFLYKDEVLKDVKHVIVLSNYLVSLWPRNITEGLLFTKYSSIAILRKDWHRKRRLSDNVASMDDSEWEDSDKITLQDVLNKKSGLPAPPGSFFIYTDYNIDKEDWYFALIKASKCDSDIPAALDPKVQAKTLHFETKHMMSLIQTLYSAEGQLHTKWFNAIINRLFLSLQHTDVMQNYLISRIEKKLNKMKTPGFLDKFQITKVRAGHGAPFITFPVLKEINPEGDLLASFYVHYFGEMSVQLATKVNINLGSRFKPREVDVLLSMTLEKLQGPMLIKIKPPPSARMWYTFEREPSMSIKIEPVISSRQMSYNIITNSIEKKLKEAVRTSLVLPHWDDFIFYNTEDELVRGGVWDKEFRRRQTEHSDGEDKNKPVLSKAETNSLSRGDAELTTSGLAISTNSATQDVESLVGTKADLSGDSPVQVNLTKGRLSSTINDLSKRLRKAKSTHTLGVDETNCLSDGSLVERSVSETPSVKGVMMEESESLASNESKGTTLRRLGKWYYKDDKVEDSKPYHPPEMITNRRPNRKQSSASQTSDSDKYLSENHSAPPSTGFSFDFGSEEPEPILTGHQPTSLRKPSTSVSSVLGIKSDALEDKPLNVEPQEGLPFPALSSQPTTTITRTKSSLHRKPPPKDPLLERPISESTDSI